mgnify:CR=1 FL=1
MKKIVLSLLVVMCSVFLFSQEFDSRLEEHFGRNKLIDWQNNHPDSLGYYEFLIDNAFLIMDENVALTNLGQKEVKEIEIPNFDEAIKNHKLINIFSLGIEILPDMNQYFKIKNEPYYLYVKSSKYLWNKYQAGKHN